MSTSRPKLLVVEGPGLSARELVEALGERFEITTTTESEFAAAVSQGAMGQVSSDAVSIIAGAQTIARLASTSAASVVLGAIGEGVVNMNRDGTVLWANDTFRGYDEQTRARVSAAGRTAARRFEETNTGAKPGRRGPEERFEVASGDDSRIFEVVIAPVSTPDSDGTGHVQRVAALIWDRTSARRFELKMEAIDRAGSELVRLDAASIRKMHVGERLRLLEEKIVRFAHDLLHFDHFSIRLIDEQSGKLELVVSSGLPPEAMEMELLATREGNGIMGYVAATGKSYLCADVTRDPRYRTGLYNARSSLTMPLRLHDRIIGVLNVESEDVAAFTEEDRQFGEMFTNHVALALHILDLLVVERCATGESLTGTVEGELNEPLQDIVTEADWLLEAAGRDPRLREHIDRIQRDVEAIRRRVREAARGPQSILGAERALAEQRIDPRVAGKRILVVDDEPRIRQIIRDVLRARGGEITVCETGGQAIEKLEGMNANQAFDLIISDIKLPDKNGYEVFSAARRVDTKALVILMTGFGYDPHHSIVRASQEGLQCVLFKPFQVERLLEEVFKALAPASPAR